MGYSDRTKVIIPCRLCHYSLPYRRKQRPVTISNELAYYAIRVRIRKINQLIFDIEYRNQNVQTPTQVQLYRSGLKGQCLS